MHLVYLYILSEHQKKKNEIESLVYKLCLSEISIEGGSKTGFCRGERKIGLGDEACSLMAEGVEGWRSTEDVDYHGTAAGGGHRLFSGVGQLVEGWV